MAELSEEERRSMYEIEDEWLKDVLHFPTRTVEEYHQAMTVFAYQFAGAISVPFMRDNPDYVMPAGELKEIVTQMLRRIGVKPAY